MSRRSKTYTKIGSKKFDSEFKKKKNNVGRRGIRVVGTLRLPR